MASKADPRNYKEKNFTSEVMAFFRPYVDRKTGDLHHDPLTGEILWTGPGWDELRIKDEPWTGRPYQERKPYDLRFSAGRPGRNGVLYCESHAVELKLVKDAFSIAISAIATHQVEALKRASAQGINAFGWVLVQFRLFRKVSPERFPEGRGAWALPIERVLEMEDRGHLGIKLETWREIGVEVPMLRLPALQTIPNTLPPQKRVRNARVAWDMSALVQRATNNQT